MWETQSSARISAGRTESLERELENDAVAIYQVWTTCIPTSDIE
jgi:hypothetical protein